MLLQLLPEILEEIASFCDKLEVENLSCCCSVYNEAFRPFLWSKVSIPSKDLIELNFDNDKRIQLLQHAHEVRIQAVDSNKIQEKATDTKVNPIYHNCGIVLKSCSPRVLDTWYLPEVVIKYSSVFDQLVELNVSKCAANDNTLEIIYNTLTHLKCLNVKLCGKDVSDEGFININKLHSLEQLVLCGCGAMTDTTLLHISNVSSLKSLRLLWVKFTDAGMEHLNRLGSLEELEISHCITISNAGMQHIASIVPLKQLDFTGCYRLEDEGFALFKDLVNLQSLNLTDCMAITSTGIENIAALPNLKTLNLTRVRVAKDSLDLSHITNVIQPRGDDSYFR